MEKGKETGMSNKKMAFAQQLEQNSKNYYPKDLFDLDAAGDMLTELKNSFGPVSYTHLRAHETSV